MSLHVDEKNEKDEKQELFFLLCGAQITVHNQLFSFLHVFELFFLLSDAQVTVDSYRFNTFCDFSLAHFQGFFLLRVIF